MNNQPSNEDDELRNIIRTALDTATGDSVHRPNAELAEEVALQKFKAHKERWQLQARLDELSKCDANFYYPEPTRSISKISRMAQLITEEEKLS